MKRFYLVGFLILLVFDTMAQVSFKLAAVHTAPAELDVAWVSRLLLEAWIYAAVASYLGAFVTYMTLLKHAAVGPAFAATHAEIVTTMLVSVLWLGERLTAMQVVGSVLIMAGIAVLAFGKHDEPAQPVPAHDTLAADELEKSALDT